jgi:hypothetical protein
MKAVQNKLSQNHLRLITFSSKNLHKSYRPTFYNLRLYYSNLRRNDHGYGRWDMVWAPEGFEKTQTDKNPNNFKYKTNIIHHSIYELRHIYGDLFYQVFRRVHRCGDPFHVYALPTILSSLYLLSGQHMFFFVRINLI